MKLYKIAFIFMALLLFSACNDNQGSFDNGTQQIELLTCDTYINIKTGDLLVKDTNSTVVKIVHKVDGSKKVCVLSGSAHIIREGN